MTEIQQPPRFHFGLSELFLATLAIALWVNLSMLLRSERYAYHYAVPFVLLGVMIAVHRLLPSLRHPAAVSAILSPLVATLALAAAHVLVGE